MIKATLLHVRSMNCEDGGGGLDAGRVDVTSHTHRVLPYFLRWDIKRFDSNINRGKLVNAWQNEEEAWRKITQHNYENFNVCVI